MNHLNFSEKKKVLFENILTTFNFISQGRKFNVILRSFVSGLSFFCARGKRPFFNYLYATQTQTRIYEGCPKKLYSTKTSLFLSTEKNPFGITLNCAVIGLYPTQPILGLYFRGLKFLCLSFPRLGTLFPGSFGPFSSGHFFL